MYKLTPTRVLAFLFLSATLVTGCAAHPAVPYPAPMLTVDPGKPYVEPVLERDAPEVELTSDDLATPDLIEQAFERAEIDAGQRLLYLAYAVYEYESLPAEFHSDVPWRSTLLVRDLKKSVTSPESLCSLAPDVRAELRRLIPESADCPP